MIDLRDRVPAPPRPRPAAAPALSAASYQVLVERRRAEAAQLEARREVDALRARHWSAERIFEESRLGIDWWEHPLADPHAMLGLVPGDDFDAATAARRNIAKAVHPDVAGDGELIDLTIAERQMAAVNGAYDRLKRAYGPVAADRSPATEGGDPPAHELRRHTG